MSPYLRARSERLRWLRSSPTWSQLPKMGTGIGPGGSLKRLPRSLEIKIARRVVKKRDRRSFSKRRRSWWLCMGDGVGIHVDVVVKELAS